MKKCKAVVSIFNFEEELAKYGLTTDTYELVLKDISDKMNGDNDLDWSEIKDKYNINCAVDTIRKASSTIFGGEFRTQYMSKMQNVEVGSNDVIEHLDVKLNDIRKEKIKLQTVNLERTRIDRSEARQELYYEIIGKTIDTLPLPKFEPLFISDFEDYGEQYVVTLADVHYSATFESLNNEYSCEIALERFEYLTAELIKFVKEKHINNLTIVSLGDLIQGVLRLNDLKLNSTSVTKATVEICRIIANMLNELSVYTEIDYFHTPQANHTQLRFLNCKASELPNEDMEFLIGNYIKDLCRNNDRIRVHLANSGEGYILVDTVFDYDIIAMHGHQIKNLEGALRDLSMMHQTFFDTVLLGHFHNGKEIPVNEGVCSDCEVLVSPSFVGSDPYSDSIGKGAKASVKIYGYHEIYGHNETYKIILN